MVIVVIGIMVAAGLAGATAGLALGADRPTWSRWRWNVAAGVGAALLVPLFLRTVSSDLLPAILAGRAAPDDLLVLAGFCLLAAMTSRRFIETLSDRVLREAREARREAERAARRAALTDGLEADHPFRRESARRRSRASPGAESPSAG